MFALTNCAKELDAPIETPEQEGLSYEIIAAVDQTTKTAIEGVSTKWVANDALNVFYAEAGTTTYSANCKFTVSDVTTGSFTGNLDVTKPLSASNDWYVLYPDKTGLNTPASTGKKDEKFFTIGSKNIENQTQNGLKSTAHLAGYNMPLYAVTKGVSSQELPSMTMSHLASVLKVVVNNSTAKELPITDIKFTAPESIIGGFYIDITGNAPAYVDAPEYKPAEQKYVSKTASLKVINATIGAGASAEFYLAIKPFSVKVGQDIKISVNGYEKTITPEKVTTFAAGKIKTLNFNFDKVIAGDDFSGTYMIAVKSSNSYQAMLALDENANDRLDDLLIEDYTSGTYKTPNDKLVWTVIKEGTDYTIMNGNQYLNYKSSGAKLTTTKQTFTIKKGSAVGTYVIGSNNKTLKLNPDYGFGFYSNNNNIHLIPVEYLAKPVITVDADLYTAQANDTNCEIPFRRNTLAMGDVSVSVLEGSDWLNATVDQTLNKVTCSFTANEGAARNAKISISHADAESQIVRISQAATGTVVHDGSTPELAYTCAEAMALYENNQHDNTKEVWITGIIIGSINNNKLVTADNGHSSSNLAIAATADATTKYIAIQLPKGNIRDNLNLSGKSANKGKTLLIKGKIDTYFSQIGLKSPSEYQLL